MGNIAGIIRPDDSELIERVMRNLKSSETGKHQRWYIVSMVFAVGSTSAIDLCREFNLDPDEIMQGPICEYCSEEER